MRIKHASNRYLSVFITRAAWLLVETTLPPASGFQGGRIGVPPRAAAARTAAASFRGVSVSMVVRPILGD